MHRGGQLVVKRSIATKLKNTYRTFFPLVLVNYLNDIWVVHLAQNDRFKEGQLAPARLLVELGDESLVLVEALSSNN